MGNAETRRHYLSEICQLRELRKEKRIQLLAMASMSSVKSAPIRKPTGEITYIMKLGFVTFSGKLICKL